MKEKLRKINEVYENFSKFHNILKWLITIGFRSYDPNQAHSFIRRVEMWNKTKGPEGTIKRVKLLRLILSRYLANTPLEKQPYMAYKRLLPVCLPYRKLIIARDVQAIRLVYTCLECSKVIAWGPKPSYDSITLPTKYQGNLGYELGMIYRQLGMPDLQGDFQNFHYSVKAGPIGRALISAPEEIKRLSKDLYENIETMGGPILSLKMAKVKNLFSQIPSESMKGKYFRDDLSLRKISHVMNHEGKLRPIAIFDYGSQSSMKGLHDACFNALKSFSQDCTFNQGHAKFGVENYCFDLSKATDRFPLKIQKDFLSMLIGEVKAKAGSEILVSEEFRTPCGVNVIYNAGQPMGAYSSGAVFSLCHHLLVQKSAKDVGKPIPFKDYYLLGDDIVIQDELVSGRYQELLTEIDVEISLEKTIKSKDFMEFAKRYGYKGTEVTPFHVCAIIESYKSWLDLYSYFYNMRIQGWELPESSRGKVISDLLISLKVPRAYARKCSDNLLSLISVQDILKDYPKNGHIAVEVLRKSGYDLGCNRGPIAQEFLLEVIASHKLQKIQDSLIEGTKDINGAVQGLVGFLRGFVSSLTNDDIKAIPLVEVLIQRSNELMNEARSTQDLVQKGGGNLAKLEFTLLPSVTRVISLSPIKERQSPLKALINSCRQFLKAEAQLVSSELKG